MKSFKHLMLGSCAAAILSFSAPVLADDLGAPDDHAQTEETIRPMAHPDEAEIHEPDQSVSPAVHSAAPSDSGVSAEHSQAQDGIRWGYAGIESRSHWPDIENEFAICANGNAQSPVDISEFMPSDLPKLKIAYAPSPLHVANNGHSIGVNYEPGSKFMSAGKIYDLLHFHFHTPSENYINGAPYPVEMQLIHRAEDGEYAVLSVMIKLGRENPAIQSIWDNIPPAGQINSRDDVMLDMAQLLPNNGDYYTFTGSLTTPPCSEGVKWHVLKNPIEMSLNQLRALQAAYPHNARPVQPLNGRVIQGN